METLIGRYLYVTWQLAVMEALIGHGADVEALTRNGESAIGQSTFAKAVSYLIQH